jgi:hypothetical protein
VKKRREVLKGGLGIALIGGRFYKGVFKYFGVIHLIIDIFSLYVIIGDKNRSSGHI